MFGFLTVVALQIATYDAGKTDPVISAADFAAYFDAAREGRLSIPDEALEEARRYRYVFVGGFHNERLPGYFTQNAKELRAKGVPKQAIHFIYPSSHETVTGNARTVREQFEDIACQGPEKLVVIAHSRGSCDALAFALQNPEFVAEHIHALFLIQGPFGGTGLADYVVGEGPPIDKRMPLGHRVVAHALAKAEGYLLDHGKHGGLPALTRQASEEFWQDMLEESSAAIPIVGPKTFYITSQIPPSGHRFFQRPIASYLEINFGENDGVVALEDQCSAGARERSSRCSMPGTPISPTGSHRAARTADEEGGDRRHRHGRGEEQAADSHKRRRKPTRARARNARPKGSSDQYRPAIGYSGQCRPRLTDSGLMVEPSVLVGADDLAAGAGRKRLVDSHRRPGREQAGRGIVRDVGRRAVGRVVGPGVDRLLDEPDRAVQEARSCSRRDGSSRRRSRSCLPGRRSCRRSRCRDRRRSGRTDSSDRAW